MHSVNVDEVGLSPPLLPEVQFVDCGISALFSWATNCTNHPDLSHLRKEANAGRLLAEEPNQPPSIIPISGWSKSRPIKQASLGNSTRSLIERRLEPLDNLNKCSILRTSRGLPFDASYACTGMHQFGDQLSLTISFLSVHTHHNLELNQGVAPPGLPHLTYRWRTKQVRERTNQQQSNGFCACVYVLLSQSHLQSLCNLLICPSTLCLRCTTANTRQAMCMLLTK